MSTSHPTKKLTIQELLKQHKLSPQIEAVLGELQQGTFGDCHTAVFEKTGVFIPELVPVFEKLDAMLAFRKAPV
jgi:hypothetical protein